ncbi:MAG TPA: hypothetical protein VGA22_11725 [Gemmatimonadales bacterium]|jgi:hypothetical protein
MDEQITQKILGRLTALSDDAGRQLLDYIEFLESRYNRSRRPVSTVEKIARGIDDTLGTGEFASTAAKGAAGVLEVAGKVVSNLASAGKAMADELQSQVSPKPAAKDAASPSPGPTAGDSILDAEPKVQEPA